MTFVWVFRPNGQEKAKNRRVPVISQLTGGASTGFLSYVTGDAVRVGQIKTFATRQTRNGS